jgi:hypothetical protein
VGSNIHQVLNARLLGDLMQWQNSGFILAAEVARIPSGFQVSVAASMPEQAEP